MHDIGQFWGWEIAVYLFLGGLAAGVMVLAAATRKYTMILIAPAALSAGMLALFLDLAHKLHVFRFYTAFRVTSPMSWGAWILLAVYPATILFAFRPTERLRRINIILGAALGAYTGVLLATLGRAAWSSLFLAPLFLASGISAAAATAMLIAKSDDERALFRRWDVIAIAAEGAMLALFFLDLTANGARGRAAASLFFGGPFTAVFWSLVVIAGLAVPFAIELFETRRRIHVALAPTLILIGGLALRWIFIIAGQTAM